jgi:hypothetical protein
MSVLVGCMQCYRVCCILLMTAPCCSSSLNLLCCCTAVAAPCCSSSLMCCCTAVAQLATPTEVFVEVNISNSQRQLDAQLALDTGCTFDLLLSSYKAQQLGQAPEQETSLAHTANGSRPVRR